MTDAHRRIFFARMARATRQLGGQISNPTQLPTGLVAADPFIIYTAGNGGDLLAGQNLCQAAGGATVTILRQSSFATLNTGNGAITFTAAGWYVVEGIVQQFFGAAGTASISAVGSVGGHWGPGGNGGVKIPVANGTQIWGRIWSNVQIAVGEQVTPTASASTTLSPVSSLVEVYRVA